MQHTPHIPGIDFIGRALRSDTDAYNIGDRVLHTSYGVGYVRDGGWAERAVTKAEWAIPVPDRISDVHAMGLGTVGLTAMLAIDELEGRGLKPDDGDILITGAAGGVGTLSLILLKALGYTVTASAGEKDYELLRQLGADKLKRRYDFDETTDVPTEEETWAGVIDCVGSNTLARCVKQAKYGSTVAACGIVGGSDLPLNTGVFVQRNVALIGINSVYTPAEKRRATWRRLFELIDLEKLDRTMQVRPFADVIDLARAKLDGEGPSGRIVVKVTTE